MSRRKKFDAAPPCAELGQGDGLDPRFDRKESRSPVNRKALQLCAQVADALNLFFPCCEDQHLQGILVESVVPAPDSSHMLVRVISPADKDKTLASLHKAAGLLRHEIANSIHRKKVPQLRFEVV